LVDCVDARDQCRVFMVLIGAHFGLLRRTCHASELSANRSQISWMPSSQTAAVLRLVKRSIHSSTSKKNNPTEFDPILKPGLIRCPILLFNNSMNWDRAFDLHSRSKLLGE
jgi:hypothetical protein